jgi:hypothetical protein
MGASQPTPVRGGRKLYDQFRDKMRALHYALATEKADLHWVRATHFQSEPDADAVSNESITAPRSCDTSRTAVEPPGDARVTEKRSAGGQYWPDNVEEGDDALEDVKVISPFLSRELRLAMVAIVELVRHQSFDVDVDGGKLSRLRPQ